MRHVLREHPSILPGLSNLLDSSAEAKIWGGSLDLNLSSLGDQTSLDDSLVVAALDAVRQCKNLLEGLESRKVESALKKLPLDELRMELRAIARDLRLAAK